MPRLNIDIPGLLLNAYTPQARGVTAHLLTTVERMRRARSADRQMHAELQSNPDTLLVMRIAAEVTAEELQRLRLAMAEVGRYAVTAEQITYLEDGKAVSVWVGPTDIIAQRVEQQTLTAMIDGMAELPWATVSAEYQRMTLRRSSAVYKVKARHLGEYTVHRAALAANLVYCISGDRNIVLKDRNGRAGDVSDARLIELVERYGLPVDVDLARMALAKRTAKGGGQ